MADKNKIPGSELIEQAMQNYEQALQAGLKLQEDSAKWWLDCLAQASAPQDLSQRVSAMANEAIPVIQKRMEDSLRVVEQTSRTSLDLMKQALDAGKANPMANPQARMQELWEASLQAVRQNAQTLTQLNAKAVESWKQCFQKGAEAATAKPKAA